MRYVYVPGVFIFLLANPLISECASDLTQFQGTFSSITVTDKGILSEEAWIFEYRLKQVGQRVCGEWWYETPKKVQEGLVVGKVSGNILTLIDCPDQESVCTFANFDDQKLQRVRYKVSKNRLERIGGNSDGSNQVYFRKESAEPKWETNQAKDSAEFLKMCK